MRDEHCHIIFDVDDGSKDLQTSLLMLGAAKQAGVDELWCTPHMRWKDFDQAKVKRNFAELKEHAQDFGIKLRLGYEVYYKTLRKQGLHTARDYVLEGTDDILIEFNTGGTIDPDWERTVYRLQSEFGLDVTWAHPERYTTVYSDFDILSRMKDAGCRIQVSAGDLNRGLFDKRTRYAKKIIKEGLCDALVSDAHNPTHFDIFAKMAAKYWQPSLK